MKKIALIIVVLFSGNAVAATYDIECLNNKGKFSDCTVEVGKEAIKVKYSSKKDQNLDTEIIGKKVTGLSEGEYSRRRVAEAVLLTPWLLFSKKKRDQIGVEYVDTEGHSRGILFSLKKKYGMALKTELKALSGKQFVAADTVKK